jgi:hypothetical protein
MDIVTVVSSSLVLETNHTTVTARCGKMLPHGMTPSKRVFKPSAKRAWMHWVIGSSGPGRSAIPPLDTSNPLYGHTSSGLKEDGFRLIPVRRPEDAPSWVLRSLLSTGTTNHGRLEVAGEAVSLPPLRRDSLSLRRLSMTSIIRSRLINFLHTHPLGRLLLSLRRLSQLLPAQVEEMVGPIPRILHLPIPQLQGVPIPIPGTRITLTFLLFVQELLPLLLNIHLINSFLISRTDSYTVITGG